jgi:Fic family protein
MDPQQSQNSPAGAVRRTVQGYWAFVPAPLPPQLSYSQELVRAVSEAERPLGGLNEIGRFVPNPNLLVTPYLSVEAVHSSRIEGTEASLSDLFFMQAGERARAYPPDVREVGNYLDAMHYGLARLADLPLSKRLVRELHARLLEGVRGEHATPGEFRRSQNWIGSPGVSLDDAHYVPPPPEEVGRLMSDWERFLHEARDLPLLIQCAIMHYQFEAIHPFLDGNGRVGRLLISLFFMERGALSQPLLYLSPYLELHRDEYYARLFAVSSTGDWEGWFGFFASAVRVQAHTGAVRCRQMLELRESMRQELRDESRSPTAAALLDLLFERPVVGISEAADRLGVTYRPAARAMDALCRLGVVREMTGQRRNRLFCAQAILDAIERAALPEEEV